MTSSHIDFLVTLISASGRSLGGDFLRLFEPAVYELSISPRIPRVSFVERLKEALLRLFILKSPGMELR